MIDKIIKYSKIEEVNSTKESNFFNIAKLQDTNYKVLLPKTINNDSIIMHLRPGLIIKDRTLFPSNNRSIRKMKYNDYYMVGTKKSGDIITHGSSVDIRKVPFISEEDREDLSSGNLIPFSLSSTIKDKFDTLEHYLYEEDILGLSEMSTDNIHFECMAKNYYEQKGDVILYDKEKNPYYSIEIREKMLGIPIYIKVTNNDIIVALDNRVLFIESTQLTDTLKIGSISRFIKNKVIPFMKNIKGDYDSFIIHGYIIGKNIMNNFYKVDYEYRIMVDEMYMQDYTNPIKNTNFDSTNLPDNDIICRMPLLNTIDEDEDIYRIVNAYNIKDNNVIEQISSREIFAKSESERRREEFVNKPLYGIYIRFMKDIYNAEAEVQLVVPSFYTYFQEKENN